MNTTFPAGGHPKDPGQTATFQLQALEDIHHKTIPFPPAGLCRAVGAASLDPSEISMIRNGGFSHYNVFLALHREGWEDTFRKANSEAKGMKLPMMVELEFGEQWETEMMGFIALCNSIFPFVDEVLVLRKDHPVTPPDMIAQMLPSLREGLHHVKIGTGTTAGVDRLKAAHMADAATDFIAFTLPGIPDNEQISSDILSARDLAAGKQVYAVMEQYRDLSADPNVSMADACNFLSRLKCILEAGIDSLSIAYASGENGLLAEQGRKIHPDFHILSALTGFRNSFVVPLGLSPDDGVISLALKSGTAWLILLGNPTLLPVSVYLDDNKPDCRLRTLGPADLESLSSDPDQFGKQAAQPVTLSKGQQVLLLDPLTIAFLEC